MQEDASKLSNKRIAKNTIVLYVRTIFTLFISLYTSRAILNILGVENYGIYNAIGGFVSMFSMISATLVASTQRYLTYELGRKGSNQSRDVFSVAMMIHLILGLVLLLLFETVGLWFLNAKMNIEPDRMIAANWVYQCSIFAFLLNIIRSPYEASIIAHEKMSTFAYVNILEALLRLVIVFLLLLTIKDKLIIYSVYLTIISIIIFLLYFFYCKVRFDEANFYIVKNKELYKGIVGFASYNFLGSVSVVISHQCVNVISNLFFGVVVNAARGITTQVQSAISKFVNDFSVAINPQITKSYAQNNFSNMMSLVYRGAKFSYFLFLFFAIPIVIQAPIVLKLWLKVVPDYTIIFVRLSLIDALITTLSNSISTAAMATGDIKKMSIWIGIIRISVLPFTYLAYKLGGNPASAYVVLIVFDIILFFVRLIIADNLIKAKHVDFYKNVIYPVSFVTFCAVPVCYFIFKFYLVDGLIQLGIYSGICFFITAFFVFLLGLTKYERTFVIGYVINKLKRK